MSEWADRWVGGGRSRLNFKSGLGWFRSLRVLMGDR